MCDTPFEQYKYITCSYFVTRKELFLNIKKYKDKKGQTRYKFHIYIGVNPKTGKPKKTNRQGFKTLAEAKEEYMKLATSITMSDDVKLKDYYKPWLESYKHNVRETTWTTTDALVRNHILPEFGNYKLSQINRMDIKKWINSLKIQKANECLGYLRMILNEAVDDEIIPKNPCDRIKKKKVKSTKEIEPWSLEEINKFLHYVEQDYSTMWLIMFRLLIFTGMRRGEVLGLDWSSIHDNTISIHQTLKRGNGRVMLGAPKTDSSIRTVYIDEDTLKLLTTWKKQQASLFGIVKPVFTNIEGQRLRLATPLEKLNRIVEKYKLPRMTIHGLRHSFTTLMYEQGIDPKSMAGILGHSSIKTTLDVYTHLKQKKSIEAMNQIQNSMNGNKMSTI